MNFYHLYCFLNKIHCSRVMKKPVCSNVNQKIQAKIKPVDNDEEKNEIIAKFDHAIFFLTI
jgi:hypothetical protein